MTSPCGITPRGSDPETSGYYRNSRPEYLTQADIDRPDPAPVQAHWLARVWEWLNAPAGGWSTVILLDCFLAGAWCLFALWRMCRG